MRILIISDIHANLTALQAVKASAGTVDHIIFAGDAVNYGPDPKGCVDWLERNHVIGVRGNHDHAVAFSEDPKASPAKQPLALAMRDWTRDKLGSEESGWLIKLPRALDCYVGGIHFAIVHGTPRDPLYDYRLTPDCSNDLLRELVAGVEADVLVTGHTHLPLLRSISKLRIVNPGSVGQPLDGDPRAAFAIWDRGEITLHRVKYDIPSVIHSLSSVGIRGDLIADLQWTLEHGAMR